MTKEEVFVLSNRLPNRILQGALGAFLSLAFVACSENLTGSLGCPELCQDQSALLRDTTLTGVLVVDTVVTGFPLPSTARDFTLLSQGDDGGHARRLSLRHAGQHLPPSERGRRQQRHAVDSAVIRFVVDTSYGKLVGAASRSTRTTSTRRRRTRCRWRWCRSSARIASSDRPPSPRPASRTRSGIPLDSAVVRAKAQAGARLRVGLRIRGTTQDRLRIAGSAYTPRLTYKVSPDTLVPTDTVFVLSKTPAEDATLASLYAAYPIVVAGRAARADRTACSRSAASPVRAPSSASTSRRS